MKKRYEAKGVVWGKCWGGGECGYASETVKAGTKIKLKQLVDDGIKNGTLDSGMGYESLIGAVMDVKTIETVEVNGKEYKNIDSEVIIFGEMEEEAIDICMDAIFV